jgi:uroporphyrinogen III methyltransferase/synthase
MGSRDRDPAPPGAPLFGKRVLVLRTRTQAGRTSELLRARGAEPIEWPILELVDPPDRDRVRRAVLELSTYDLVAFTSENGVEWLFTAIEGEDLDARAFGQARVAAVGPATAAALRARGAHVDLVAVEFVGEGLAEAIIHDERIQASLAGGRRPRVLLPRALVAREVLPEALRSAGCEVDVVPVYETRPAGSESQEALRELFERGGVDLVLLTSSSTVDHLCALLGDQARALLSKVVLASIGPITTRTATARGLTIDVTTEDSTMEALIEAAARSTGVRP